jgi:C-3',4' desaturase CrtD
VTKPNEQRVVVIGAGIGGLTTAAILARAGMEVTVLEAHIYPGGCAGTFYHQEYRFDAGATLSAGFYAGGPMDLVSRAAGIPDWPVTPATTAMQVHFPDGERISVRGDDSRWERRERAFGPGARRFFDWQEARADALWNLALRSPAWPPQSLAELLQLGRQGVGWLTDSASPGLLLDALRPVSARLQQSGERLRLFVDGQLLISAQTTSAHANALYGAAALDLARRGVVHLEGGMGAIAQRLVQAVRQHGGRVLFRKEAVRIVLQGGRPAAVETRRAERFEADIVIANLPPWNIRRLLGDLAPRSLKDLPDKPQEGWGAFMVYLGVDQKVLGDLRALHHQILRARPLGEGNSIYLSISPEWDLERAPDGHRAVTISTHTDLGPWWRLYEHDRPAYEARKQGYLEKVLDAAECVFPDLRSGIRLVLPGTPVTFQRFTRRAYGWVGGFPQTSLFKAHPPRLSEGLWMVGDSIFPGQSTAAVALGGLRVARSVLEQASTKAVHKESMPVELERIQVSIPSGRRPVQKSGERLREGKELNI